MINIFSPRKSIFSRRLTQPLPVDDSNTPDILRQERESEEYPCVVLEQILVLTCFLLSLKAEEVNA